LTILVFSLVLASAFIHATWNFWLKVSGDRVAAFATIGGGWAIAGLLAIPLLGAPEPAVWPYLLASTLVHGVYALALLKSYKLGNLSSAYPIARGIGPLVVALASSILLGEELGLMGVLGIVLIIAGAVWVGFPKSVPDFTSLMISVATGALIGTYTLLDGLGGRAGSSPHVFAAWLFLFMAFPVIGFALATHRSRFGAVVRPILSRGLAAGVLSAAAYWIVIWAMSEAHMGLVAALRESSVLFAAGLGAVFLHERVRWFGVALVFVGIVFARLA
jgi:drug/metabolite transporter (DMT)-like permease